MQCYLEDFPVWRGPLRGTQRLLRRGLFARGLDLRDRAVLRRSRGSLVGWKKPSPESSRNPLPWVFACFIALHLCLHCGRPGIHAAACLVLQFDAYLRPGVAVMLRRENVVPPVRGVVSAYRRWALLLAPLESGTTSKTGTRDDSVIWGISPARVFIAGIMAEFFAQFGVSPQLVSSLLASWLSFLLRRPRAACSVPDSEPLSL